MAVDVAQLLAFAVKNNASDLHLSAGVPPMIFTGDASDLGKRCRNTRAKRELGWTLRYPTYREGASLPAS